MHLEKPFIEKITKNLAHYCQEHFDFSPHTETWLSLIPQKDAMLYITIELANHQIEQQKTIETTLENWLAAHYPQHTFKLIFSHMNDKRPQRNLPQAKPIPNIKNVILVGSGKGGVGKSTTAYYLADALQKLGHKVGLLDADIYGPSLPDLSNLHKPADLQGSTLIPHEKNNMSLMSVGFLVPPEQALIWRGPMITSCLQQMLFQTKWPKLDYLIIDLPPGTGDITLSLSQKIIVQGTILITTSHPLALSDVTRAKQMLQKLNLPILGVVETMSPFYCESCAHPHYLFGKQATKEWAHAQNISYLGHIPFTDTQNGIFIEAFTRLAETVRTQLPTLATHAN